MMRSRHLAVFAVLIAFGAAPFCGAATASLSGLVRDSSGVPQIGVEVQLLRPDLSVISSVYTNGQGRFVIASLLPGRYALKAMGPAFLPSLRENVKVRGGTVVNLTLNTLYEVIQWLPADPRAANAQKDDWAWTLRSAANRPLLRWLEDGPLVVVSDGSGTQPKLMARLMATGQAGTFGESGERISTSVEDTPSDSRELLARVDFAPDSDAGIESMLGFRQDLGFAGSVQSVAAVTYQPDVESANGRGLEEATVRSEEAMHLGDGVEAEAGGNLVMARLDGVAPSVTTAMLPFATVSWHDGSSTLHYGMATMLPDRGGDLSQADALMPEMVERNGEAAIERGVHQEFGWERQSDSSSMSVLVYADNIENPALEALGHFTGGDGPATSSGALFDPVSSMIRVAGPSFSSAGVQASVEHRLPGGNFVRVSYASGSALVMSEPAQPANLNQVAATARPHRGQVYSIALSGTLDGTGTRWRASYSWQPDDAVTEIAPYSANAAPFFNVQLRQPIHRTRDGSRGFEALVDMRNLLAEGYCPYLLSDGSLLIFAPNQRSLRAGLAFTF
jgi:hypothetical protein